MFYRDPRTGEQRWAEDLPVGMHLPADVADLWLEPTGCSPCLGRYTDAHDPLTADRGVYAGDRCRAIYDVPRGFSLRLPGWSARALVTVHADYAAPLHGNDLVYSVGRVDHLQAVRINTAGQDAREAIRRDITARTANVRSWRAAADHARHDAEREARYHAARMTTA